MGADTHGMTIWLTGLSGAGKSTVASGVHQMLTELGLSAAQIDGDILREGLNSDLDFTTSGRAESVRRAGEVARLLALSGVVAIVSLVSPYGADRDLVRERHQVAGVPFVEVWVSAPLEVCEQRDTKGLYARARRGDLRGLTGVDDPYETPRFAELELATHRLGIEDGIQMVVDLLGKVAPEVMQRNAT